MPLITHLLIVLAAIVSLNPARAGELERVRYNNPGLVVDLGVGLVENAGWRESGVPVFLRAEE